MEIKKPFNTLLEKDITKHCVLYGIEVLHKNGKFCQSYEYSNSFTLDEIYKITKEKHKNKICNIIIKLKK